MYLSINPLWPLKTTIITSHPTHNRSNRTLFLNDFGLLKRTVGPKLPTAIKEPRQGTGFSQPPLNAQQRERQLCVLSACLFFLFSLTALDTGRQTSRVHFSTSEKDYSEMESNKSVPSYNIENSPFCVTAKTGSHLHPCLELTVHRLWSRFEIE